MLVRRNHITIVNKEKTRHAQDKDKLRADIAEQTRIWLSQGNQIQRMAQSATGFEAQVKSTWSSPKKPRKKSKAKEWDDPYALAEEYDE